MRLSRSGILDRELWAEKGYTLPEFDVEKMAAKTREKPSWVHFGAGNLFRAFHAGLAQKLLNGGETDIGIIVAEGYDRELIGTSYTPYDNLSILAVLKADGKVEKTVIGSVAEALSADKDHPEDMKRLIQIFHQESLRMCTFTITEKGYGLTDGAGSFLPAVEKDMMEGPGENHSYPGMIASLLYERFQAGELPLAMVSTDNCSGNGDLLKLAMVTIAECWAENRLAPDAFLSYLEEKVSFPITMIDKITPRPDEAVLSLLKKDGLEVQTSITEGKTYTAPFVNAEEPEYLVVEDLFPNGRPPLEKAGVIFAERETVRKTEKMKVSACLNPLHTALAVFGCMLGYEKIADEMRDEDLRALVYRLGYREGMAAVEDPGIIKPETFLRTVLEERLPNSFLPDTPQRIATDTSRKLAVRFGETIRAYQRRDDLDIASLKAVPAVLAGWLRYLQAVDDEGKPFSLSPDPVLEEGVPDPLLLLKRNDIFGVDLGEAGLEETVLKMYEEMMKGPGSVRSFLRHLKEEFEWER